MKKVFLRAAAALCALCALLFICGCGGSPTTSYDWILKTIQQYYYYDIPEDELHERIMTGGVSSVLDRYSAYYTASQYAQITASNAGNKSGIGVSYMYLPEGASRLGSGVFIASVTGGSPAQKSGLKAGEFVRAAERGGERVEFSSSDDFSSYVSSLDYGQTFTLITDRGEHEMSKSAYTASYCTMSTSQTTYSFYYDRSGRKTLQSEGIDCLPEGAAYLRLDQFYGNAVNEFAELINLYNNVEHCTSLILDLRGNGGGYVDVMCGISGIFGGQLEKTGTPALKAVYKDGSAENFMTGGADGACAFPAGGKVSVLADNGTASASEALIGALISFGVIDYADVYISDFSDDYLEFTGTAEKDCRTYGKGIMQSSFTNRTTGEVLKLTTAKIYWPNGTCIHDVGLTSEDCPTVPAEWDVTYGDEQLALAVKMIYG